MPERSAVGSAFVAFAVLLAARVHGMDVSSCGQVVPRHETGRLVDDLACSADGAFTFDAAVTLDAGAVLDLAGHRIQMAHDGFNLAGVDCNGRCSVTSSSETPGEIVGTGPIGYSAGVFIGDGARGRVTNVHIEGFASGIIGTGSLNIADVTLTDNLQYGATSSRSLRASDTVASGNEIGLGASRSITALRTKATGNHSGLHATRRVRGTAIEVTGNTVTGIDCWDGDRRGAISLRDSTVTGSGIYDLLSGRRPRLVDSTCGTSHKAGTGETWGVCSGD